MLCLAICDLSDSNLTSHMGFQRWDRGDGWGIDGYSVVMAVVAVIDVNLVLMSWM